MTVAQSLIAFTAAATVLTLTPGVDTAMVLRSATTGARSAAFAALGIGLGCLIWGGAVSLGLGALLAASETAFMVLKWAGAAYLLYLGVGLILKPRSALTAGSAAIGGTAREAFTRGLVTNLLNPKVGVFYITFLPQFIPTGVDPAGFSFVLASVHVLLGFVWFALLIAATVPLGRFLARPRVVKTMDRLTGGVFIAFGLKLALSRQG
ncbi:LysE family translocator [Sphingosinicella microcystinivorans]|uniref:LysE family translocator n=1 Tax=Sphingosinicella microcystinivorans TaxID=335406 RepID=UPI0022F3F762|nr:LysE family translocator [Sphingosinicella microcystinivorans]WBX86029.1 LysE family translocator [Sphingosinicella microcystinivorans]